MRVLPGIGMVGSKMVKSPMRDGPSSIDADDFDSEDCELQCVDLVDLTDEQCDFLLWAADELQRHAQPH
jgi:hypothetical protein